MPAAPCYLVIYLLSNCFLICWWSCSRRQERELDEEDEARLESREARLAARMRGGPRTSDVIRPWTPWDEAEEPSRSNSPAQFTPPLEPANDSQFRSRSPPSAATADDRQRRSMPGDRSSNGSSTRARPPPVGSKPFVRDFMAQVPGQGAARQRPRPDTEQGRRRVAQKPPSPGGGFDIITGF